MAVFRHLRLRNFKAYKDSKRVPLRPLTVILGANNSGKSSLLHGILLLAQTLDDTTSRDSLVTSGAYVDLGGYFDILWGGQDGGARRFSIDLDAHRDFLPSVYYFDEAEPTARPTSLSVAFDFDRARNSIAVSSCSIEGDGEVFAAVRRAGRGYTLPGVAPEDRDGLEIGFRHFLPTYRPTRGFRDTKRRMMELYVRADDASISWSRLLGDVGHVAPLRQPVPRFGILGKSPTSELGPGGENLLRVLRATDAPPSDNGRLVDAVNSWIAGRFEMLSKLRLVDVDESGTILALLGDERGGFENINVANMGEGISQLLPIIARVLTTPAGGCLLIEQPELHLHPAAQADLADLFVAASEGGDRQYIIETHSEHLLLRLRRKIAEGAVSPDDVAVLFVERKAQNSVVRELDLNMAGHFEDWPDGFFEERYREALAIAEAAQRRRSSQ